MHLFDSRATGGTTVRTRKERGRMHGHIEAQMRALGIMATVLGFAAGLSGCPASQYHPRVELQIGRRYDRTVDFVPS